MSSQGESSTADPNDEVLRRLLSGFHNESILLDLSRPHLKPSVTSVYPVFVFQYALLVVTALCANLAALATVLGHSLYRDPTHCYVINLAIADLVKCLVVLPVSLAVLLVQNWIFGRFLCYFLPMLQDIPMHVSTLTLLLIAWDRHRLLEDPLRPRIPAFVCATGSWLMAICIVLPYPLYITYIDLQEYFPQVHGVGVCFINLLDDMQEYMRGLFIAMYALPLAMTAYLYVKMSRELQDRQDDSGGQAAPRLSLVVQQLNNQQTSRDNSTHCRDSVCSSRSCGGSRRGNGSGAGSSGAPYVFRSPRVNYDIYDAELDVSKERRAHWYLGTMTTVFAICLLPLMFLRVAKLALTETYENSGHFDITYTMFVWIAFLPTCTTPALYIAWRMSRVTKERLRGYLRLSRRRGGTRDSETRPEEAETRRDAEWTTSGTRITRN